MCFEKYYLFILLICIYIQSIFGNDRIVTIGGSVTEIVYALDYGDKIIATDLSSTIPNDATKLPQVGYVRSITTEGILSMMPSLILATSDIGPPNVLNQLREVGIRLKIFDSPKNYNDVINLVDLIARELRLQDSGKELIDSLDALKLQVL